ncbi:MAG: hypothetical protein KIT09_01165 [Bryobacteraceae bacterium]|nr:hypothetical protein [Bryobacteraceae bacterium]
MDAGLPMTPNKFLLVKGHSGLGNRMESVLTGLLYARLAGRRLLVDWTDRYYSGDGANSFFRFFQCPSASPADVIPVTDSVRPAVWRGCLTDSVAVLRDRYRSRPELWQSSSVDIQRLDYEEDVLVMWLYSHGMKLLRPHFTGSFAGLAPLTNREILRQLIGRDLMLHPSLVERVNRLAPRLRAGPAVGVHVRYSDHQARLWAILRKLNSLLRKDPRLQVFLATDNLEIERMFEKNYPGAITAPHWYPPAAGLPIHTSPTRPDPVEIGCEALIDLYLLARCQFLIIDSSSSFSCIATLLTDAPESNIFDVRGKKRSIAVRRLVHRLRLRTQSFSWGPGILGRLFRPRRGEPSRPS